jgi:4-hydroxyacetophenone monooxygenase
MHNDASQVLAVTEDDAFIEQALKSARILPLAVATVHLTGDLSVLRSIKRTGVSPRTPEGNMTDAERDLIRATALKALAARRDGKPLPPPPNAAMIDEMIEWIAGQKLSPEYVPMMVEELGMGDHRALQWSSGKRPARAADFHTVVIGAGMSGLLQALRLDEAGLSYTVIEKNYEVGGTWYENMYPGCRVDSSNHFYSYSFDPNNDWSEFFSQRDELLNYFKGFSERYQLRRKIRFNTEVTECVFDDVDLVWAVKIRNPDGSVETLSANAVVSAVGQLNRPRIPDFKGRETFRGPAFHSAEWEPQHQLEGKRIAVIGSGATAFQLIPEVAKLASHLVCIQRQPGWMLPNPIYHDSVDDGTFWLLKHAPFYQRWYRFTLFWNAGDLPLQSYQVDPSWPHRDRSLNAANEASRVWFTDAMLAQLEGRPDLIEKVVPTYPPGGKRLLQDNGHYLRALRRDNVEVVAAGVQELTENGLIDTDGKLHEVDVILYATGFHANKFLFPMKIVGRGGQVLSEIWDDTPRAYLGITVPDFPNLFLLYGPSTNLAHGGSIIFHSECQVRYVMECLKLVIESGAAAMDVTRAAFDDYVDRLEKTCANMVWAHTGATNWYKNARGIVVNTSPWRLVDYWTWTLKPDPGDYDLLERALEPA